MVVATTPTVYWAKLIGVLPFSGRFSTSCGATTCPMLASCVPSRGGTADTSTVWVSEPAVKPMSTVGWSPELSVRSCCSYLLKPLASTVKVYVPGFRNGRLYSPASLLTAWAWIPVAWSVAVIVTCGTTAPVESARVPLTVAVDIWALATAELSANNAAKRNRKVRCIGPASRKVLLGTRN